MTTPPGANFYDIIAGRKKKQVFLASGGVVDLFRLPFIKFLEYEKYRTEYAQSDRPDTKLKYVLNILSLYDVDVEKVKDDIVLLFYEIAVINYTDAKFAWQTPHPDADKKKERLVSPVEYPGRDIAYCVAILSSMFSWTSDFILFTLTYDEVNAFTQEALLIKHERDKMAYNLADIGFKTSADGKSSEKIPYPDLYWATPTAIVSTEAPKIVPKDVYDKYMPNGVVVDLTNYETAKNIISEQDKNAIQFGS